MTPKIMSNFDPKSKSTGILGPRCRVRHPIDGSNGSQIHTAGRLVKPFLTAGRFGSDFYAHGDDVQATW